MGFLSKSAEAAVFSEKVASSTYIPIILHRTSMAYFGMSTTMTKKRNDPRAGSER